LYSATSAAILVGLGRSEVPDSQETRYLFSSDLSSVQRFPLEARAFQTGTLRQRVAGDGKNEEPHLGFKRNYKTSNRVKKTADGSTSSEAPRRRSIGSN